jgi:hypothetical protein
LLSANAQENRANSPAEADQVTDSDTPGERIVIETELPPEEDIAPELESTRPAILGMTIEEELDGRAFVTEVGATSPAWDAGIRRGDEIISLHGMRIETFPEWVEGVRKVIADAVDGQSIPIEIVREGSPLDLQVKVPIQRSGGAAQARRSTRIDSQQPTTVAGGTASASVPYPAGAGAALPVGAVATGDAASQQASLRAAAELHAVSNPNGTETESLAADQSPATPPTGPGSHSARIGSAVFVDGNAGMLAGVTLGGLPQGSYSVVIANESGQTTQSGANTGNLPRPPRESATVGSPGELAATNVGTAAAAGGASNLASPSGQVPVNLGVIHVRKNQVGHLRERMEGIRVADVVGQTVLVLPSGSATQSALIEADQAAAVPRSSSLDRQIPGAEGAVAHDIVARGVIQLMDTPLGMEPSHEPIRDREGAPLESANPPTSGQPAPAQSPAATTPPRPTNPN